MMAPVEMHTALSTMIEKALFIVLILIFLAALGIDEFFDFVLEAAVVYSWR